HRPAARAAPPGQRGAAKKDRRFVNYLTPQTRPVWQACCAATADAEGVMQLQEVRYFLAVHQERSFTRAARRCGVSQPSLTNAIRRLEQDLGGALFLNANQWSRSLCLATRSIPTSSASRRTQILHATRRRLW